MKEKYVLLFYLVFQTCPAFSQNQHVRFEHIGTNSGLSQSNIECIFQDNYGFMWFGTYDGLNKYDGYTFTSYKYDPDVENGLSHSTIMDLAEDGDHHLWIATWGGGLNRFDRDKENFTRYRNDSSDPASLGKDHISKLFKDSEGVLWIATEGGGLNKYDKKHKNFSHYRHETNNPKSLSDDFVKDITEDAEHNLWIATNSGGLNLFDRKTNSFRSFRHNEKNRSSLSSDCVWNLFVDSKDRLWIGTHGGGLNVFDREKVDFIHFKTDPSNTNSLSSNVVRAISEDNEGRLWIGTENGGIDIFDSRTGFFDNHVQDDADNTSLSSNTVVSIFKDAKGNMWLGTFGGGIDMVGVDNDKFIHYAHSSSPVSLNNNSVITIFEDSKNNLWFGTNGGGLNLFNSKKGTFTHYKHEARNPNSLGGDYVLAVCEDGDGNLWIGTWGDGITVFNKEKKTFKHFTYDSSGVRGPASNNIWTIARDAENNMWIGTYGGGLSQYDRKTGHFITYRSDSKNSSGISNDYINIIYEDREGNLWIGANGSGLDLFNKKSKTFSHLSHQENKKSISNNDIYSLTEDLNGNLWIATGLGLNRMNKKTQEFTSYYLKDGLPGNIIAGLLFDGKDNLWVSTYNGLSRYSMSTRAFKNFDASDGLQSNEFKKNSCYRIRSGKMYFGGVNGFNCFFPDSIKERNYDPPLVFTNFLLFNKEVPVSKTESASAILKQSITGTNEIGLNFDQSVISFEFASLNYVTQNKKQYSYKLETFDKDWNDIGVKHTATYTNLNPGHYVFIVRGLNNEGVWSSKMASLRLHIAPPYWMTWWFRLAILLGIAGCIVAFYKFRVHIIKEQKIRLEQQVKQQTQRLLISTEQEQKARREAEQANNGLIEKNKELEQFAYVASHDLQEPLRMVTSFLTQLEKKYGSIIDDRGKQYIHFAVDGAIRMRQIILDLLEYSRVGRNEGNREEVELNRLVSDIEVLFRIQIKEKNAVIRYGDLPVLNGYKEPLRQVFQNLVGNALKYSSKDRHTIVEIRAREFTDYWEFAVVDNGIGIDNQYFDKVFILFQRLHNKDEFSGTGIGLAITKKIIENMGGKIWVESTEGEGSSFFFTLLKSISS